MIDRSHIIFKSNNDEWATPQDVYDALNSEFHFNLDPCCTAENAKCEYHFTAAENGLLQSWGGILSSVIRHIVKLKSGCARLILNRRIQTQL